MPVFGDLILAPMDGISDLPFRMVCRSFGSAMGYTEFINSLDVLHGHPNLERRLAFSEGERPVVYQLFDSEPERMLQAARKLLPRKPDIIDINMGCSVSSVSGRGAGAGMLRDPIKVGRAVALLSGALDLPVTAKIRLGWDDAGRNYLQVARAIEENGGVLVAVHARTRAQRFTGEADWDAIAEIKQAVSIPVIANGDVRTTEDIVQIQAYTRCDGVMIGRGAIGNPWIFARRAREDVANAEVWETMQGHLKHMLSFYGERRGLVRFRKHAKQYLLPLRLASDQSKLLFSMTDAADFLPALGEILA